ncbi:hypothetical protein P8C59_008403 [Phyllachora maydis]|uniref:Protein BTN n=1 Tax=Phyllachora maydis TaxID=1825666 RepID=A0AAD9MIB6_9PEZI|nr:hypothetical protein P8C59_008403 [Phyllachora maydis]
MYAMSIEGDDDDDDDDDAARAMSPSRSSSGFLPLPGSPSASWALYRAKLAGAFGHADSAVLVAFWLFGLINNVLYVIILSAAQDLVGHVPKGVVLLADVLPSFLTKLVAPYFIHRVPYSIRIPAFVALSSAGMCLVALTPPSRSVAVKLSGVVLSSLSSGGGELSFLGLAHFYGPMSLAAWGSGTGAAGLAGAGLYVLLTDWLGFGVRASLLASACLPVVMLLSFFFILPHGPLRRNAGAGREYETVSGREDDAAHENENEHEHGNVPPAADSFRRHVQRARALFLPYMVPLLLVYTAEYTINQGVAPTLLFPLAASPFGTYRAFYPFYGFLYQLGVFVSRSSTPFVRVHRLYVPALLQVANLALLALHALWDFIPSVYLVFAVVFWEGLLGGAVYVNTFAEIMDRVPPAEREFSLGATSVSDSAGICAAGFVAMALEVALCDWQVRHGRDYCRRVETR